MNSVLGISICTEFPHEIFKNLRCFYASGSFWGNVKRYYFLFLGIHGTKTMIHIEVATTGPGTTDSYIILNMFSLLKILIFNCIPSII